MRSLRSLRSLLPVLVLVLAQTCSEVRSQVSDPSVLVLARSWSEFSLGLFRVAASQLDQNVLLSSGASVSLSSVMERSAGTGREQLQRVLTNTVSDSVSGLRAMVGGTSLGGVAWFVAQGAEPDDAYRKTLEQVFGAEIRTLDFSAGPDSADSIERWILDQTQGRVLIPKTRLDLGPDPQLVLASALSLQARFAVPFNVSQTGPERFFVNRYRTEMVPMMLTSGRFFLAYDRTLKTGVLRLGLDQGRAALVLLPDEGVHVSALEDRLNQDQVQAWIRSLKKTRLEVQFPRFVLEQSNMLKTSLRKMGVTQVFADNSLSQVLDAAALVVDESAAEGGVASSFKTPPPRLTVNRPFLLVVYHEATGALQMIGRVVDPTQK